MVLDYRFDPGLGAFVVITQDFSRTELFTELVPYRLFRRLAGARPRRARLLALALHGGAERIGVDRDAARAQRILGQIERKAEGVVERECGLAVEPVALFEACGLLVQD